MFGVNLKLCKYLVSYETSKLFLISPYIHVFHSPLLPSTIPSIRVISNESALSSGGQSIGVSASASVLPMNTQDWSPLRWNGWISLQSKGLSRTLSIGKHPDAWRDWGQEEKGMIEHEMPGWYHRLNRHEFEQTPGVCDGQGGLVCCDSWSHKELDTTEWLNSTELKWIIKTKIKILEM